MNWFLKKSAFLRCLDDLQILSSNVYFINSPDPDPKLRLQLDPGETNYFGFTTLTTSVPITLMELAL
jgi:hypothetical protein